MPPTQPCGAGERVSVAAGHPSPCPRGQRPRGLPCSQEPAPRSASYVLKLSILFSLDKQTNKRQKGNCWKETGDGHEQHLLQGAGAPLQPFTLSSLLSARTSPPALAGKAGAASVRRQQTALAPPDALFTAHSCWPTSGFQTSPLWLPDFSYFLCKNYVQSTLQVSMWKF